MSSAAEAAQWEEEEEGYLATQQLLSHHAIAMAVKSAIELDVFNILARAGAGVALSAAEIARSISGCDPVKSAARLDRVLRFLASHDILLCSCKAAGGDVQRHYALQPLYRLLSDDERGVSLAPAFLVTRHTASLASWQYLKEAVLEDINPFEEANGAKPFEYMAEKDPKFGSLFNEYMANNTKLTTERVVDAYSAGFEGLSTLVDVGGGFGALLGIIISKHPHIRGINFDLPHVISTAPTIPGVEHVAGNIFETIPSGDAILLKMILHDWSDENCVRILKNCYKALPLKGKAIIMEHILPEVPQKNNAVRDTYFMDLCMMVSNHQSRERTEKEFRALARDAGFDELKVVCRAMNCHIMELIKL